MNKKIVDEFLRGIRILVVDDEELLAWSIENELKAIGAEVLRAGTLQEALKRFSGFQPDLAICDLHLPDGNGMELVKKWKLDQPDMPVILITAHGAMESAIAALRFGAFDYLQKPFDNKSLIAAVQRASEVARLRQKVSQMEGRTYQHHPLTIVGNSPAMDQMRTILRKVATSNINTVLITGESGSGKELAARAIHEWSDNSSAPFVEINCASIPENLLESELFGFERGAFTDARERKLGLFEIARSGTVFLDEIGELPVKLQSKLLRVLEYRRFKRLGGTKDIEFSARIVAATNRNLQQAVSIGDFRSDLYYRLAVFPIQVLPLRQHIEDLPQIAEFILGALASELKVDNPGLSEEAKITLCRYSWPGNIRELKNVLQRALVLKDAGKIQSKDIDLDPVAFGSPFPIESTNRERNSNSKISSDQSADGPGDHSNNDRGSFALPTAGVSLDDVEKNLLKQALEQSRYNQTRAAELLGISRHTLRYRLQKYGIQ